MLRRAEGSYNGRVCGYKSDVGLLNSITKRAWSRQGVLRHKQHFGSRAEGKSRMWGHQKVFGPPHRATNSIHTIKCHPFVLLPIDWAEFLWALMNVGFPCILRRSVASIILPGRLRRPGVLVREKVAASTLVFGGWLRQQHTHPLEIQFGGESFDECTDHCLYTVPNLYFLTKTCSV